MFFGRKIYVFLCYSLFFTISTIVVETRKLSTKINRTSIATRSKNSPFNKAHLMESYATKNKTSDHSIIRIEPKNFTKIYTILLWTPPEYHPFVHRLGYNMPISYGRKTFIDHSCVFTNCFVSSDRNDYYLYDVIAFSNRGGLDSVTELPSKRLPSQKYAFVELEPPAMFPLNASRWNGFFNWTWTYRLDSDARIGYIIVRDTTGRIIGPRKDMHWVKWKDMDPVPQKFKNSLRSKKRAAAWFVSNCKTQSKREFYALDLKHELKKYNLTIDIIGTCGKVYGCVRADWLLCNQILKKHYFFYLAFENSLHEDYVTEKILYGLHYNTVPIVFGGANYTRFMPHGSYLDARRTKVSKLAAKINELMHDIDKYAEYFKWKNHYDFQNADGYPCEICALLNNEEKVKQTTIYDDIFKWWNV